MSKGFWGIGAIVSCIGIVVGVAMLDIQMGWKVIMASTTIAIACSFGCVGAKNDKNPGND